MFTHGPRNALALVTTTAAVMAFGGAPAYANCTPGAADKPDLGFVDSNCDGIDGDKAAALFVAPPPYGSAAEQRQLRATDGKRQCRGDRSAGVR